MGFGRYLIWLKSFQKIILGGGPRGAVGLWGMGGAWLAGAVALVGVVTPGPGTPSGCGKFWACILWSDSGLPFFKRIFDDGSELGDFQNR